MIETPAQAGLPANTLLRNYPFTFSPRVGLAYQPFGSKHGTVIRGGYGRYIYPVATRNSLKNPLSDNPFLARYTQNYDSAPQSPDGITHYLIRNPPPVITGSSGATSDVNAVNSNSVTSIVPGGITPNHLATDYGPTYVTQTNFTIEQPLKGNSALRLTWLWSHGTNLDEEYYYNAPYSSYAWEMKTGTLPPQGTAIGSNQYANTALNSFDQITYSSSSEQFQKTGWSNDNALQVNYQRLFHRGIAYQIMYVWSKPFRVGGNGPSDSLLYPNAVYVNSGIGTMTSPYGTVIAPTLPPPAPAGIAILRGLACTE